MASDAALKDLNVTSEELDRLQNALKDETFRKMFVEYAEEISNPENRKLYEQEIAELERNRGMDVKFIKPEPGFVLKTCVNGDMKAFVNCCSNDNIGKPESKLAEKNGHKGYQWSIPHSLSPSREDLDKEGKKCQVFDCVFHPFCFTSADNDPRFRKMIEDTALDGIEREFKVKLDRNNVKPLKNMKYKGRMSTTVIRTPNGQAQTANTIKDSVSALNLPYPYDTRSADVDSNGATRTSDMNVSSSYGKDFPMGISQDVKTATSSNIDNLPRPSTDISVSDGPTVPNYTITHRGVLDMQQFVNAPDSRPSTRPQELVVRINLPLLKSACGIQLDVFTNRLFLETNSPAAASYRLDISLPFPVDENHGSAKFDRSKSCMVVTLPVEPPNVPALPSFAPLLEDKSLVEEINDGVETITLADEVFPNNSADDKASSNLEKFNEKVEDSINRSSMNLEAETELPQEDCKLTKHSHTEKALNLQNEKFILPDFSFHQCDESISIVVDIPGVASTTVETQLSQDGRDCWIHFQATAPKRENKDLYGLQLVFPEGSKMSSISYNVTSFNLVFVLHKEDGYCNELHSFKAGPSKGNLQVKKFATQHSIHDSMCGLLSIKEASVPNNVELKTVLSNEDGTSQTSLDIELEVNVSTEKKKKTNEDNLVTAVDSELSIDISTTSSFSEHASSPDITPLSPHSLLKSSLRSQRKRSSKSVSFSDEVVVGTFVASQGRRGRKKSPYIRRSKQKLKAPAQEICSDSELILSYKGGDDSEEDLWNIVPPRKTVHRQSSSESESDGLSSPKGKHKKSKGSRRRRKEKARKALMLEGSPEDTKLEEDVFSEKLLCKESLEGGALSESLPENSEVSSAGDDGDKTPRLDDQEAKEEEMESDDEEDGEWTTVTKKRNHKSEVQDEEDKDIVELDKLDHHTQSAVAFSNSVMFDLDDD